MRHNLCHAVLAAVHIVIATLLLLRNQPAEAACTLAAATAYAAMCRERA